MRPHQRQDMGTGRGQRGVALDAPFSIADARYSACFCVGICVACKPSLCFDGENRAGPGCRDRDRSLPLVVPTGSSVTLDVPRFATLAGFPASLPPPPSSFPSSPSPSRRRGVPASPDAAVSVDHASVKLPGQPSDGVEVDFSTPSLALAAGALRGHPRS